MKIKHVRRFITAAAVPALIVILLLCVAAVGANAQNKPNVVIMLADNVGYGDIGAYGAGEVRGMPTPRIDSIAQHRATRIATDAVLGGAGLYAIARSTDDRTVFCPLGPQRGDRGRHAEYSAGE